MLNIFISKLFQSIIGYNEPIVTVIIGNHEALIVGNNEVITEVITHNIRSNDRQ